VETWVKTTFKKGGSKKVYDFRKRDKQTQKINYLYYGQTKYK